MQLVIPTNNADKGVSVCLNPNYMSGDVIVLTKGIADAPWH